jgi:TRAP-type C4-dicarboxylate transport system substrate-binding protein
MLFGAVAEGRRKMMPVTCRRAMTVIRKFLIASGILLSLSVGEAMAQAMTVRIVCFLPPRSVSVDKVFVPWMKTVEAAAEGDIKFQPYWGGSLGRNPFKQYDLMKDGIADIIYVLPNYTPGQFPDFSIFELPYLIRSGEEGSVAIWRMHQKGLMRGLEQGHVIGFFSTEPNLFHTTKPIGSLSQIRGLKIRAAGPVYGSLVKHLGGVPIGMPVTQMTEAISRGVVDGALLGWGGSLVFRLHSVTSHHYEAPLGISPFFVSMNMSKWNALSAKGKAALTKYGGEYLAHLGGKAFDDFAKRGFSVISKDKKQTITRATPAEIEAQAAAAQSVHDEWIKDKEGGAEKYAALKQILADIRAGR